MIATRWASGLLAVECLVCLFFMERGVGSTAIAALFFLFFVICCWTFRAQPNPEGATDV